MAGHLTKRILFAVVAIPATMGVLWLGGWWLAIAIGILGILGAREVFDLARRQAIEPLVWMGYLGALAAPVLMMRVLSLDFASQLIMALTLWTLAILVVAMKRGPTRRPLPAIAITAFAPLYTGLTLSFLIVVRHGWSVSRQANFALVLFPLVLTWICDTFAYMVGSQFGGPKMAPVLSPNKTWSGAVGGAVSAIVAAGLLGQVLNRLGWRFALVELLVLGLAVGIVAQVGDVAESLLKREAGVKDSSNLLPGHGGILDRLDSLYFVIPVYAALILYVTPGLP